MNCTKCTGLPNPRFKTAHSLVFYALSFVALYLLPLPTISQILQIKKEVAFGSERPDFGNHRMFLNKHGEIMTMSQYGLNEFGLKQWRVSWFSQQLAELRNYPTNLHQAGLEVVSVIGTNDGSYMLIGSADMGGGYDTGRKYDIRVDKLGTEQGGPSIYKDYGGNGDDRGVGVQQTSDGGYLIVANTLSTDLDFQNMTGSSQVWLAKLDRNGEKIWGKLLTNSHEHTARDFIKTPDGNFAICGNVNAKTSLGGSAGTGEAFIMKLKEDGTVLWQTYTGGTSADDKFERITTDAAGHFVMVGSTSSNLGGAPGNHGSLDGWLAKADANGNIYFNKLVGGSGNEILKAVTVSSTGIITAGGSTTSTDGDMADNVYGHTIWITRLSDDNLQSTQGYFGHDVSDPSSIQDLITGPDGTIYATANSGRGNPFMKQPLGSTDGWLFAIGEKNILTGAVFIDANQNGNKDANESYFYGGHFEVMKPSLPSSEEKVFSHNENFEVWLDSGEYTARYVTDFAYYRISPAAHAFKFTGYNQTKHVEFALQADRVVNDLAVDIIAHSIPRPGLYVSYSLLYKNQGTIPINNVKLQFVKDSRLEIISQSPDKDAISGDTLTWTVGTLNPFGSGIIQINGRLNAPPTTTIGDTLLSTAIISPQNNDETPADNLRQLVEITQGSYDPNGKTELHGGILPIASINTERLTYLIRFQNTGTDTAFNVFIRDTLNAMLDPATVRMIAASHPFTLTSKNNELEWKFDKIMLPDSNVNENASHGYVLFSARPKQTLSIGDVITNSASIYFDFNLPVVTNTTSTKIIDRPIALPRPIVAGLLNVYCQSIPEQTIRISNLAAGTQVNVKIDNNVVPVESNGNFTIKPSALGAGQHTLEVTFSLNGATSGSTTQFAVTAAVTPVLRLASTVTIATNNITAVEILASAVNGGGNAPTFIFAKDRAFTKLLQHESSSNLLFISSMILETGDNWIYVQMRTNAGCFMSETAIDSVRIIKTSVTGIVDVDFPTIEIIAYPMPFESTINVKGLQPTSAYLLQLIDASGKIVSSKEVNGQTATSIKNSGLQSGNYFLRLYDKKKKRLIGTITTIRL